MQSVAASGGYYTSVACDKIIAEPTTITGSIGVIMGYFVVQDLFEQKLGITPVIVKSGQKKDWPSSFQKPTEEQAQYLMEKLITPAYQRFVRIIANERPDLSLADVYPLADGSIYHATEALDLKLIDQTGYIDQAIELVMSLANISNARVIRYQKPFSLSHFLSSSNKSILNLSRTRIYELNTPDILYLWNVQQ